MFETALIPALPGVRAETFDWGNGAFTYQFYRNGRAACVVDIHGYFSVYGDRWGEDKMRYVGSKREEVLRAVLQILKIEEVRFVKG